VNEYLKEKEEKHHAFFNEVIEELELKKTRCDVIAVLHVLPDAVPFHAALSRIFHVSRIVPKPRSINHAVMDKLPRDATVSATREDLLRHDSVKQLLRHKRSDNFVLLDIGGYFAPTAGRVRKDFGARFRGVVEDTENGLQKYLGARDLRYPVLQVARSPLKDNEDYMVGRAIAFSAESLLRNLSILVNGRRVGVIGYGKVGRSVAEAFRLNQGNVSVFDSDHVRLTHAYSRGFGVLTKERILRESDILCLATGNMSLAQNDFLHLKEGAFLFSVTSSDDEMDLTWVRSNYASDPVGQHVERYSRGRHSFYLFNQGNAINFIHGNTVGDFILLVHAEIILCAYALARRAYQPGIHELDEKTRDRICAIWLSLFAR
jgi:adenosylhomocysteinase